MLTPPLPAPTAEQLQNLINFVRDLVGDASSESCDCAQRLATARLFPPSEIIAKWSDHERSTPVHTYTAGVVQIATAKIRFRPFLADNAILTDAAWTAIPVEDITYSVPWRFGTAHRA